MDTTVNTLVSVLLLEPNLIIRGMDHVQIAILRCICKDASIIPIITFTEDILRDIDSTYTEEHLSDIGLNAVVKMVAPFMAVSKYQYGIETNSLYMLCRICRYSYNGTLYINALFLQELVHANDYLTMDAIVESFADRFKYKYIMKKYIINPSIWCGENEASTILRKWIIKIINAPIYQNKESICGASSNIVDIDSAKHGKFLQLILLNAYYNLNAELVREVLQHKDISTVVENIYLLHLGKFGRCNKGIQIMHEINDHCKIITDEFSLQLYWEVVRHEPIICNNFDTSENALLHLRRISRLDRIPVEEQLVYCVDDNDLDHLVDDMDDDFMP